MSVASARFLLDTSSSQLVDLDQSNPVDLDGSVPDGLAIRVGILADELSSDNWVAALARKAGIRADQIDLTTSDTGATHTTPLARRLLEVNAAATRPYVVRITTDGADPFVNVFTVAPTTTDAKQLADATVATYESLVGSDGTFKTFVVQPLGATRAGQIPQSSGRAKVAALALFALCAWLVTIVFAGGLVSALIRSRRGAVVSA